MLLEILQTHCKRRDLWQAKGSLNRFYIGINKVKMHFESLPEG